MPDSSRRSILCPHCRKLISVDEPRCPYCNAVRPGARWKNHSLFRTWEDPESFVRVMIGVNVVVFVISILMAPKNTNFSISPFEFLSPDSRNLLLLGASGTIPIDRFGRWWTLLTANYLHGSVLHILFNMLILRQIAPLVCGAFGTARMFVIYTAGGVLGYWASYMAGIQFTIGASAAVCALMGAAIYYGKSRGGVFGQMIFRQIGGWVIGILIFGLLVPGINNWGHLGGLAAGAGVGFLLGYQEIRKERFRHKVMAMVCVVGTVVALIGAIGSGFYYILQGA